MEEVSSSGHVALTDHVQGKKHAVKKISTFFTLARKLSDKCEKEDKSNHNKLQTLDMCVTKSDTLKAEVIWTLKLVMNGFSVRANDELKHTFAAMFPDSQIDISFSMARTNTMYVINPGLAPYFKCFLLDNLKKSDICLFI